MERTSKISDGWVTTILIGPINLSIQTVTRIKMMLTNYTEVGGRHECRGSQCQISTVFRYHVSIHFRVLTVMRVI